MAVERIPIADRAQWLSRRKFDITASSVGAVFGVHPFISGLKLYVQKQGLIDLADQPDSGPLRRGRILEHAIPAAAAEQRPQWELQKNNDYFTDHALGLGATPDFFISGDSRGPGILQAKTAAPVTYDKEWRDGAPYWVRLQLGTELMLAGVSWGAIGCLVIDPYELPFILFETGRDAAMEQKIRDGVTAFWKRIEEGDEPRRLRRRSRTSDQAVSKAG